MNDGNVRNFYIPTGATNYSDPLSENIKRAIRQIHDNKDNQIAASNQKAEVDPQVEMFKTLNNTLKGVTAAKTAANTISDKNKTKKDKKQKEKDQRLNFLVKSDEEKRITDEVVKFNAGARDIYKNDAAFKAGLDKAKETKLISPELYDELINTSPSSILTTQTWQVNQQVATAYARHQDAIQVEGSDAQIAFLEAESNQAVAFRDWLKLDLKDYGLDDKAFYALAQPEGKRQIDTKQGIQNAAYNIKSSTARSEKFVQNLETALKFNSNPGNKDNINFASTVIQGEYNSIYADNVARNPDLDPNNEDHRTILHNKTKNRLTGLIVGSAYRLELDDDQLESLRGGTITHPAGNTAELLLTSDDWKLIDKNITAGREAVIRENEATATAYGQKELATYLSNPDKYEGDLDQVALNLIDMGLPANSPLVTKLQNMNLQTQNSDSYKAQREDFYEDFIYGDPKTRQDMLDNKITNDKLNDELSKLNLKLKAIDKNNLLKDDFFKEESHSMIQEEVGEGQTLSRGQKLKTGSQRDMQGIIQRKFHEIYTRNSILAIKEGRENDKTIASESRKELKAWLTERGFGLNKDNSKAGRFSHNSKGEFPGASIQTEVDRETKGYNVDESLHEVNLLYGKYDNKQQVVDSGEAVNSAELISFAETGFKVYPKDIILKAEIMGIDPSELVQGKINALLDSKDPADQLFIKAYKLTKNLEIPKAGIDVRGFLEKAYRGSDRKDLIRKDYIKKDSQNLLYALEYGGFTPKQYERIVELEGYVNNFERPAADASESYDYDINTNSASESESEKNLRLLNEAKADLSIESGDKYSKDLKEKLGIK